MHAALALYLLGEQLAIRATNRGLSNDDATAWHEEWRDIASMWAGTRPFDTSGYVLALAAHVDRLIAAMAGLDNEV